MKKNKTSISNNSCCKYLEKIIKLILNLLKKFEVLSSTYKVFGLIYHKLFYAKLIKSELEMANLKPGDKIVHIGSGPFPTTAISLARQGYEITGIDVDKAALKKAKALTKKLKLNKQVEFKLATVEEIDFSEFDAVWISLHVIPKTETINKIIKQLSPRQKLIYRNPRGLLTFLYEKVAATEITNNDFIIKRQPLGKESVLIKL